MPLRDEAAPPPAASDEVALTLTWTSTADGALDGVVRITNISGAARRVGGKPTLQPLGSDGTPLPARCVVSAEMRLPGYVVLQPGETATAAVRWAAWDGAPASGKVVVTWPGGERVVDAYGPAQPATPATPGCATTLSSSWFSIE